MSERETRVRVVVVDDHVIVRHGLEQLLATATGIELVGQASDGAAALVTVAELLPDVVLMDLSMPVMDGVQATAELTRRFPLIKIVILTSFSEQQRVVAALNAGAHGYVLKHADPEQIIAAIHAVGRGGMPIDPQVTRALLDASFERAHAPISTLTEREAEVLRLVYDGLANKQIARRLGIAERTVKAHLTKVFQTLGVSDRTQAALWAATHLVD